jgi:diguanylate cyclase (GGDEF)-like protein
MALFHDQPVALEARLHGYMDEINALVAAPDSELSRQNVHVTAIVALSEEVLGALDMVVSRLQEESRDRINRFRFMQAYLLATTLAVLLLQGMFIFQPAVNLIQKETENLEAANRELQRLSNADGLTGIANRRLLDEFLEREWSRAARQGTSLTLIMVDIDFFKNYNDTYGHHDGDECLKRVANALEASVKRSSDLVARYGGEEFAVVLPDTSFHGGVVVAEKLRSEVEKLQIEHRESPLMKVVTISLGVATIIPGPSRSPEDLIVLADQLLYQAKQQGRNRAVAHDFTAGA